jgi:hypothetical protein
MANTFKNAGVAVTTSRTTLYTCPAATQALVSSLYLSNIDGTNNATVTIEITIDGGSTYRHIGKNVSVPAGSTLVLDKAINLEAGDIMGITASATGDIEAVCSILEVS